MEVTRDLGLAFSSAQMKQFMDQMGVSESAGYGIRKELYTSPAFLQMMAPLAQAQGQMESLLSHLERVTTSWGTFNLRAAFESAMATGNWAELNKLWGGTVGQSGALNAVPGLGSRLLANGTAQPSITVVVERPTIYGWSDWQDRLREAAEEAMRRTGQPVWLTP